MGIPNHVLVELKLTDFETTHNILSYYMTDPRQCLVQCMEY